MLGYYGEIMNFDENQMTEILQLADPKQRITMMMNEYKTSTDVHKAYLNTEFPNKTDVAINENIATEEFNICKDVIDNKDDAAFLKKCKEPEELFALSIEYMNVKLYNYIKQFQSGGGIFKYEGELLEKWPGILWEVTAVSFECPFNTRDYWFLRYTLCLPYYALIFKIDLWLLGIQYAAQIGLFVPSMANKFLSESEGGAELPKIDPVEKARAANIISQLNKTGCLKLVLIQYMFGLTSTEWEEYYNCVSLKCASFYFKLLGRLCSGRACMDPSKLNDPIQFANSFKTVLDGIAIKSTQLEVDKQKLSEFIAILTTSKPQELSAGRKASSVPHLLKDRTIPQLKETAKKRGISLKGLSKKADMIAKLSGTGSGKK
jgi:hypothetical protein